LSICGRHVVTKCASLSFSSSSSFFPIFIYSPVHHHDFGMLTVYMREEEEEKEEEYFITITIAFLFQA